MHILFVHSIGKNKFGGGEKWLITVAEGLKDCGHKVFVGGLPGSRLLKTASRKGMETVSFNILSDISVYYVFRIASFMRINKIDVLITKGKDLAVTGVAARMAGKPVVLVRYGSPLRSSLKKHAFLINRLADGVITNTRSIKKLFEMKGRVKKGLTRVIYNGYNGTLTGNDFAPYNFSADYPGKKIILSAGRLATPKGYFYLVDAVELLGKEHDDIMFVVLGEGKLYNKLVAYAKKKGVSELIHFEGFVENVVPYLKGCDLFVLPSLYEGMPNAAMEAMAHGKPVIITDVNGARELIPDEGKGVIIPPRDPLAIARAVERLINDSELCVKIGNEAGEHIRENFSVSKMISNIHSYINEIMLAKNK